MTRKRRIEDRLFWSVFGASAIVAVLTMIAVRLTPATPLPGGSGPMRPRMRMPGPPANMGDVLRAMGVGSLTWYVSILSAPVFVWLSRRLPFDGRRWRASLVAHLVAVAALVSITAVIQYQLSFGGLSDVPSLGTFLRTALLTGALPFVTVAAAAHALEAWSRARDRELDAARARSQLAEVRLEALTAQLQPHFLFNTLQAISTLISRDAPAAEKMLANLSDLLREVLRLGEKREVALSEELRVLESYLDISRKRFGERLTVAIDADTASHRALVPFFVLQPLVENALHHGVGSRAGPASVRIGATRDGDRVWLTVSDDGPGAELPDVKRGIGLSNTKARLEELYGSRHSFELGPRAGGGFQVRLGIPYRESVAPA